MSDNSVLFLFRIHIIVIIMGDAVTAITKSLLCASITCPILLNFHVIVLAYMYVNFIYAKPFAVISIAIVRSSLFDFAFLDLRSLHTALLINNSLRNRICRTKKKKTIATFPYESILSVAVLYILSETP